MWWKRWFSARKPAGAASKPAPIKSERCESIEQAARELITASFDVAYRGGSQGQYDSIARRILPILTAALDDPDPAVRREAIVGLYVSKDPETISALLRTQTDPDASVRARLGQTLSTMWSLAHTADPRVPECGVSLSKDTDGSVRAAAAPLLAAAIDRSGCESSLSGLASDPDSEVRASVASSLERGKGEGSVKLFRDLVDDADRTVRLAAITALSKSYQSEHKRLLTELMPRFWRSDESADVHRAAWGDLIPHNTHAGVAVFKRPSGGDSKAMIVHGQFKCATGCYQDVSFERRFQPGEERRFSIKCSCGAPISVRIATKPDQSIWVVAVPQPFRRTPHPEVLRIGMTITKVVLAGDELACVPHDSDKEQKLWV